MFFKTLVFGILGTLGALGVVDGVSVAAYANTGDSLYIPPQQLVRMVGEVGGATVRKAAEIVAHADKGDQDIYLLINSPGGDELAGSVVLGAISVVQARGVRVHCLSTFMAASMGYLIWDACTDRYALPTTKLLFHPVQVSAGRRSLKEQDAAILANELRRMNKHYLDALCVSMAVSCAAITQAFHEERLWTGEELDQFTAGKYLHVVTKVWGVPGLFDLSEAGDSPLEGL